MGGWGISPNAPEKEKIKSEWADVLHGYNSCAIIDYSQYCELFDIGMDLLDRMYELGKVDGNNSGDVEELEYYRDLKSQGKLMELPCLPNEKVWSGKDKDSLHRTEYNSLSAIVADIEDGCTIVTDSMVQSVVGKLLGEE